MRFLGLLNLGLFMFFSASLGAQSVLDFPDEFALYATTVNGDWSDACQIRYEITNVGAAHVQSNRFRFVTKHHDIDQLYQLKQRYSVDGQDQPDGVVKLHSCKIVKQAGVRMQINAAGAYYVRIRMRYLPNGFWPRQIQAQAQVGQTFVRKRQLQCAIGPMFKENAEALVTQLNHSRQQMLQWLGAYANNSSQGFYNISHTCVIRPKVN